MADTNAMVRVGIVMDVDSEKKRVRVYYPDLADMVSDWLIVPQRPFRGNAGSAPFRVHAATGQAGEDEHTHPVSVSYEDSTWLPWIDDVVLVIYTYGHQTDGYVIGVIP